MLAEYQRTRDRAKWAINSETLRSMGARHSEQLKQHYGLAWC
jgi:hypothetical protein